MTFIARVVKHSTIWKAWRRRHATGGEICHVPFRAAGPDSYETGPLTADQVNKLRTAIGVHLVSFGGQEPVAKPTQPATPIVPDDVPSEWRPPAPTGRLASATIAQQQQEERRKTGRPRLN